MIKTEMNGTGGGRWMARADAKALSNVARRHLDRIEVEEQLESVAPGECDGFGSCAHCVDPEELDAWMDYVLDGRADPRPLTVWLVEAI